MNTPTVNAEKTSQRNVWIAVGVRTPFLRVDGPLLLRDSLTVSVPVARAMAEQVTGRIHEAAAVATINAPADPTHVCHLFGDAVAAIERDGQAEVKLAGRSFRIRREFLEDIARQRLDDAVASMRKPLLIFHGPKDEIVGIENAAKIFAKARHPKSFVSLDTADHLLTRREDTVYVAGVLAAWATRYVGNTELAAETATDIPPGRVVVEETGAGRFAERVRVGRHVLAADEPLAAGGTDTGPGPSDYLLAGLGACTAMTLRMYADRKQWPLGAISVRLAHNKIYATDCEECEPREGMMDRIERSIEVTGALAEEERSKLLEIAGKCPLHRTLTSEIDIRTRLAG